MKKQKMICLGLATLLLAGVVIAKPDLILVDKSGALNEWELVLYNPVNGAMELKGLAGKMNKPFAKFNLENKRKIIDWLEREKFEPSTQMRLSVGAVERSYKVEKKKPSWHPGVYTIGEVEVVSYNLSLANVSPLPTGKMKVEIMVFCEDHRGANKRRIVETIYVDIPPAETWAYKTRPVQIRDLRSVQIGSEYSGDTTSIIRDRLKGMYLCISKKNQYGNLITRELERGRLPKKEKWPEYKVEVNDEVSAEKLMREVYR